MKKLIIIAAVLLLAAGCSSQNKESQPIKTKTNQTATKSRHLTRNAKTHLTQASSITLPNTRKATVKIKQAPGSNNNPFDFIVGDNGLPGSNPTNPAVPGTPSNQPNQAASPEQTADSSSYLKQVLDLVNQERSKAGLNTLSADNQLDKVAFDKAKDLYDNNYFDHQSPTYGSPFDMMKSYGVSYSSAGENIAKGQTSPQEVMSQWMNSPGHRANILNTSFTNIGIGYYNNTWVQEFTG
ncbi:CAP domain-containing protein [Paenibacillus sp. GCM10012307]|uniref:SCP-like extracellular n=1 Tax=Paenibacillus roseus TaxID=2798579 RepID=A0A934J1C7_9BACL|nr:CAP domain-containing protein [Paenibacillus roseus]MBJ6359764.1 SCP-like extracellular [Paenibacillus roseus]